MGDMVTAVFGKYNLLQDGNFKYIFDQLPCKNVDPNSSNCGMWAGLSDSLLVSEAAEMLLCNF